MIRSSTLSRRLPNTIRSLTSLATQLDPLEVLQRESHARNLCDEQGFRKPTQHFVASLAIPNLETNMPPNLRTVGIERISPSGIDFCQKRSSPTSNSLANGAPVAFLYTYGRFTPGERVEQWRAEGHCEVLHITDILKAIPEYTIIQMVGSYRLNLEITSDVQGVNRQSLDSHSHAVSVMQQTTQDYSNKKITDEESEGAIRAFRFQPDRIECLNASPEESVLWERYEWIREDGPCPEGSIPWKQPVNLAPH